MNNPPSLYLFLHKKLSELTDEEKKIEQKTAKVLLPYIRIPKKLFLLLAREMEKMELVKMENYKLEVLDCKCEEEVLKCLEK